MSVIANSRPEPAAASTFPWFALRVRSNFERVAATHLHQRGYEEFSPYHQSQRQWSDRRKTLFRALFPGYVFCRFDFQDRLPVLTVPGVVGIVGLGKESCPIPDCEIEKVRTMVRSGLLVTPWPYLERGQTVLIERGPLTGLKGILLEIKDRIRVVVSISLLQRSVSAEIDREWVRQLPASHALTRLTHGPWVSSTERI
jgi:transcription antitermination factor NusG